MSINKKRFKYGSMATAVTVVVIVLVVLMNIVVSLISDRVNLSIDMTPNKTFEISQETKDYLGTLDTPVNIVVMADEQVFAAGSVYFKQAYEILKKYVINSDKISLDFVDMTKDPTYVNRYSEIYKGSINEGDIVIEANNKIRVTSATDLFNIETDYSTYYTTGQPTTTVKSSKAEQVFTSNIMYVTDANPMTACIFSTESASSSISYYETMFNDNGYDVVTIDPLTEAIPEEADICVLIAPLNDYPEDVINKLYSYLDNGGKLGKNLIYVADYAQKDTPNIDAFLAEWGIKVDSGVLYDSNTENLTAIGGTVPAIYTAVTDENYTEKLAQPSLPVLVPLSRPIKTLFDTKDTRSTEVILSTYSTGYAVTEDMLNEDGTLDKSKITEQNYNVMVMGKKYYYENNVEVYSKVLAIGSSMMLDEYLTSLSYINNGEYFVEVVNDMCGKDSGMSIVAKDFTAETFDMTKKDLTVNLLVFIVIIPAAIIITCVVVCVRRRNR